MHFSLYAYTMFPKLSGYAGVFGLIATSLFLTTSPVAPAAATITTMACDPDMTVNMRVLLAGPYDPATNLMSDSLRTGFVPGNPVLPTTEPYSALGYPLRGGEGSTISLGDTSAPGPANAPVDWIVVELRSADNPSGLVATDITVVNRDGSVVPPVFEVVPDSYYVAVRHRNHLGVMTANPVLFDGVTHPTIDFTSPDTLLYVRGDFTPALNYVGSQSQLIEPGVRALWAGDVDGDKRVIYAGTGNEVTVIYNEVLSYPGNTAMDSNFDFAYGYLPEDADLNGKVKHEAPDDDPYMLFNTVVNYPANVLGLQTFTGAREHIPPATSLISENDAAYDCELSTNDDSVGDLDPSDPQDAPTLAATGPYFETSAIGLAGVLLAVGIGVLAFLRLRKRARP